MLKPALVVLNAQGQRPELQALSPPDTFLIYLKMSLVAGVILAMPLILTQIWRFVAVGLYSREKRFMRLFTPVSLALFIAGVLFMFFLVLPVVLNFFVTFSKDIRVNDLKLSFLQSWVVGEPDVVTAPQAAELNLPQIPIVSAALLTPPDVISQVLLAIPMIVLFEGALLVSKYVIRKRPTTAA